MRDSSEIKVSVILTVYNSASFLRSCLDSILSQTLKEIEIICIDDESEDGSDVILEDYSRRDERISVIRLEHSGAGAARNCGLDAAHGKYVSVLDADDFFEQDIDAVVVCRAVASLANIHAETLPDMLVPREMLD